MGYIFKLMNTKRNINSLKIKQLHFRMRDLIKLPKLCPYCKLNNKLELANKNHKYNTIKKDWIYLCRSCHQKMDYKSGRRISGLKGHTPWNKGIKTGIKPWLGKKRPDMMGNKYASKKYRAKNR